MNQLTTGASAKIEARPLEIPALIERLNQAVTGLELQIARAEDRFYPVVIHPPKPETAGDYPMPQTSLGEQLNSILVNINRFEERIANLANDCQL